MTGACQCGAVRYEVRTAPVVTAVCHCLDCQKFSASAFSLTMVIDTDAFHLLSGELTVYERPTAAGGVAECYACPTCSNRVYHRNPDKPEFIRLKPGGLDDKSVIRPELHCWTSRAQSWVEIPDDLPNFEHQYDLREYIDRRKR